MDIEQEIARDTAADELQRLRAELAQVKAEIARFHTKDGLSWLYNNDVLFNKLVVELSLARLEAIVKGKP